MKKIDAVMNELANGKTISEALKTVTRKRHVKVPFTYAMMDIDVTNFGLDTRMTNALKRSHFDTIADVLRFVEDGNSIRKIPNIGRVSTMGFMEKVLDYIWEHMDEEERATMLIKAVGTN